MSTLYVQLAPDGRVARWSSSPFDGQSAVIETDADPLAIYVHEGGVFPLPPSPGEWAVFDPAEGAWSDPRDPVAVAAEELQVARETASLSRAEFLLACVGAELMTPEDALLAAKGEVPGAFAAVIEGWPEAQQFEAGLRWAALTQVDRLHPLIVAMAAAVGVSDAQLDAIFGISGDET